MNIYRTKLKLSLLESEGLVDLLNDAINLYEIKELTDYKITNPKELIAVLKHEYLEKIQERENPGQFKMEF